MWFCVDNAFNWTSMIIDTKLYLLYVSCTVPPFISVCTESFSYLCLVCLPFNFIDDSSLLEPFYLFLTFMSRSIWALIHFSLFSETKDHLRPLFMKWEMRLEAALFFLNPALDSRRFHLASDSLFISQQQISRDNFAKHHKYFSCSNDLSCLYDYLRFQH